MQHCEITPKKSIEGEETADYDERKQEALSCLRSDDEEAGKLSWLWADAGCSASWWEVGPPVSGSPRLPFLCCGESDRWSPKVPFWSQRRFFRPACFFPPQPEGNLPGEHASHARPQPSTAARVNCLQRGVALPLDLPQTLYCLPVDVSIPCIFALKSCVS